MRGTFPLLTFLNICLYKLILYLQVTCPAGSEWSECANSCEASCGAIHDEIPCTEQCVPGCTCPVGFVFDYSGICVDVKDCPCWFENQKYLPGESHMQVKRLSKRH